MVCSNCLKNEADIHFKGVVNGKTTTLDVCGTCAEKLGIPFSSLFNFPSTSSSFSELFNLLSNWPKSPTLPGKQNMCPQCRWTLAQIQKTGKLGCPECYAHFHKELSKILKTIHGSDAHKGKTPSTLTSSSTRGKVKKKRNHQKAETVNELKLKLEKAVKLEKYEEAAQLRDKIQLLEEKAKGGS